MRRARTLLGNGLQLKTLAKKGTGSVLNKFGNTRKRMRHGACPLFCACHLFCRGATDPSTKGDRHFVNSLCILLGLAFALPRTVAAEVLITKIDGTQLSGELTAWNAKNLSLLTKDQTVTIASSQLLHAQWPASKNAQGALVELTDGTRLPHQGYEVEQGRATIDTSLAEQSLTLSTDRITVVQLSTDMDGWQRGEQELDGDLLVVRKKKTDKFDHLTGILGDISSKQVEFTWDGEAIRVKRSKVAALVYFHTRKPDKKTPVFWLNLRDGGRLPVAAISFEGQNVQVRTTGGIALSFALKLLRDADYSQGKLAYLSDLQPIEQRWTPLIGLPTSAELIRQHGLPRRNQSFSGSAISLRWPPTKKASVEGEIKTYAHGLALRSRSEIRYRLPKGMRRFVAFAGIDPETASEGNVMLEIFADRRSIWQGEIDGSSAPRAIDVTLGDARELRIVVDYGKNLDFGDRLHLAEARLSR